MEEKTDYLALGAGRHFSVPFDEIVVFSTNLNPLDLADEAFLRRIGYKIKFPVLTPPEYAKIWQDFCHANGIVSEPDLLSFVVEELHGETNVPLLPCHPRDLLGMALDQVRYHGAPRHVTKDQLRSAWDTYFVSIENSSKRKQR
jgi:hypothetical protein